MSMQVRRKSGLVTAALGAGALVYLIFVFLPGMRSVAATLDQARNKFAFVSQAGQLRPTIEHLKRDLQETREYVEQRAAQCPRPSKLTQLLGQLDQLAADNGVSVVRFEPQPATELETLIKVPVLFSIEGSFEAIHALLAKLEKLPAVIWVEEIDLEKATEAGKSARAELNLVIFADRS